MRALHLIGMRTATGGRLRFHPPDDTPLVLPSWLRKSDREILLAFYQQVLGDENALPRVEVDWNLSLGNANRTYLRNLRDRHGSAEHFLVVKVRRPGVDLLEVQAEPVIQSFQNVAIACNAPAEGEHLGRLNALVQLVAETAQETYDALSDELSLRADGPAMLEALVRTLLNPILVAESYNALIDVQAEGVVLEGQREAVYRRILGKVVQRLPEPELTTLAAVIVRGPDALGSLPPHAAEVVDALRRRMLLRDGKPTRWARLLRDEGLTDVVRDRLREIVAPAVRDHSAAREVLAWFADPSKVPQEPAEAEEAGVASMRPFLALARALVHAQTQQLALAHLASAAEMILTGRLDQARDDLAFVERELDVTAADDETRAMFVVLLGLFHNAEGRQTEALHHLREAWSRPGAHRFLRRLAEPLRQLGLSTESEVFEAEAAKLEASLPSTGSSPPQEPASTTQNPTPDIAAKP